MANRLAPGQSAPWFYAQALEGSPRYAFDTAAGRWTVMLMLGGSPGEERQAALDLLARNRHLFDDMGACFFGVATDPEDVAQGRIARQMPGIRWFLDYDVEVSTLYGAALREGQTITYRPHWLLLDYMQRVRSVVSLDRGAELLAELRGLVTTPTDAMTAPVLVVPGVLPPAMCRRLIGLYEEHGGKESGFMREENGITVPRIDHSHKRRRDYMINDQKLIAELKARLMRTLVPMIQRAFQFQATRIERFNVACYDAAEGGHFRPHRDNTTKGTAHRKFACTINLNAHDYDGGDLCFPEFGRRTYRAPSGGAVVFSCSLLHEARPVTNGRRYAFLPFLYDDDGARIREQNLDHVAPHLRSYRSGLPVGEPQDT